MSHSDRQFLSQFDSSHVWHPYTSMTEPLPTWPVESASGVRIKLADGRELIDGMSSWWSAIHGYNHPVLNEAATRQLGEHALVSGFLGVHQPQLRHHLRPRLPQLQRLAATTPGTLKTPSSPGPKPGPHATSRLIWLPMAKTSTHLVP